jgi:hypothetical protein
MTRQCPRKAQWLSVTRLSAHPSHERRESSDITIYEDACTKAVLVTSVPKPGRTKQASRRRPVKASTRCPRQ